MSFFAERQRCLSFYYHMYGLYMGTLRILVNGTQQVFTKSGNQGNIWISGQADIPAVDNLQVI